MADGEGMKRESQVYPNLFYALESPRVKLMEIDSAYDSLEKSQKCPRETPLAYDH